MKKRRIAGFLLLFLSLPLLLVFILFTETGLRFIVGLGDKLIPATLNVGVVSGRLASGFAVSGLSYVDKDVSVTVEDAHISWRPRALFSGRMHISGLDVSGVKVILAEEEKVVQKEWDFSLPDVFLPFAIVLDRGEIRDVEIRDAAGAVTRIEQAVVGMTGGDETISIDALQITAEDFEVDLAGKMGLQHGRPAEITGEWWAQPPDGPRLSGTCSLTGPVQKGQLKMALLSPFSVEIVSDYDWQERLDLQATIVGRDINPGLYNQDFPGRLEVEASVTGQIVAGEMSAEIVLHTLAGELRDLPLNVQGKAKVGEDTLGDIELLASVNQSQLSLNGAVTDDLDFNFDLRSADIGDFLPETKGRITAQGRISGPLDLPVIQGDIKGDAIAAAGVTIGFLSGTLSGTLGVSADLSAKVEAGDIQRGDKRLDRVDLVVTGGLDRHNLQIGLQEQRHKLALEAEGRLRDGAWTGEVRDIVFSPRGGGDILQEKPASLEIASESVVLGDLCLNQQGAEVCLAGSWQSGLWRAIARISDFNPGLVAADWPGQFDAEITGSGDFSGDESRHHLALQSLSGSLRDKPVAGGGVIDVQNNKLLFKDFFLEMGEADLAVSGIFNDTFDVTFSGRVPDVAEFVDEGEGQISLSGSLKGKWQEPVVALNFDARALAVPAVSIEEATGAVAMDMQDDGRIVADIHLAGMATDFLSVNEGDIQIAGTPADHSTRIVLATSEGELRLGGEGKYDGQWSGSLSELLLVSKNFGEWRNDGEIQLFVGPEEKGFSDLCLQGGKAHICLSAAIDGDNQWTADGDVRSFSLSLINDLHFTDLPLDGKLRGTFKASGQDNVLSMVDAEATAADILLSGAAGGENLSYSLQKSRADLRLADSTLTLDLQSHFQGESDLNLAVRIAGADTIGADWATLPIAGELNFAVNDLGFVSILTESLVRTRGKLKGNLALSGMTANPDIRGDLILGEGGVDVPSLGVGINDITVAVEGDSDILRFTYRGSSGEGQLSGQGTFRYNSAQGWQIKTNIIGSNFQVVATDGYDIHVNPDLHLELDQDQGSLKGKLQIPYARITSTEETESIDPSDDVVIVDDVIVVPQEKWPFTTDVSMTLGEDVQIDAFGLKSYLTGQLELKDVPGKVLTALGELVVKDGVFSLYSTELEIDRGRLLFTGGPVDNPGVDFRGQRKVETKIVGVDVGGTVNELEFFLFSDPAMEESEILAYLLVGKSMYSSTDEQQSLIGAAAKALGVGGANQIFGKLGEYLPIDEIYLDGGTSSEDMSLVLGKNITKELFIGYDHNFFDSSGDFKIRYKLGRGFFVETKSSANATSGDILYSIER